MKLDVFACSLLVAILGAAPAWAQDEDAFPPNDMRRLSQAVRLIRTNYITPVDDARLAGGCAARLTVPGPAAPATELTQLPPLLKRVHAAARDVPYTKLVNDCLTGMLAALDAQSKLFTPQDFRGAGLPGPAGVGVELGPGEGGPEILWPFEGGPADKAGVLPGDRLIEIDDWATAGASMEEITPRLRGATNSSVTLVLERAGVRRAVTMQRAIVRDQTVRVRVLDGSVWHVQVWRLREDTLRDLERLAATTLKDGRPPRGGIVLDLRDDTGGLLTTTADLASAFLAEGLPLGTIEGRKPRERVVSKARFVTTFGEPLPAEVAATLKSAPLVVLVNGLTAVGAEFVAAALQSNGRARVVGAPTAGVGMIQTFLTIPEGGAIRLTTARWLGPKGEQIEGRGITPDVTLATARGPILRARPTADDTELAQALEVLRRPPAARPR